MLNQVMSHITNKKNKKQTKRPQHMLNQTKKTKNKQKGLNRTC